MSQPMETTLAALTHGPSPRNAARIEEFLESELEALSSLTDCDAVKIRLVTTLFSVFQSSRANVLSRDIADRIVPKIVAKPSFFESIFRAAIEAEPKHASLLLKLVYEALFSILPSSSILVADYLTIVVQNLGKLDGENVPLALLVGAQFLSFADPQDSYLFDEKAVETIKTLDLPPIILAAWGVALSKLTSPPPWLQFGHSDGLRHKCREIISSALDKGAVQQIISISSSLPDDIQYAHTMSSLLHALVLMTQMSQTLANALAAVLEHHPQVAAAFWDEQTSRALYLTRAKMPASISTFQSLARSVASPFELLQNLESYMDFVQPEQIERQADESVLTDNTVIFPARKSDNQGGVTFNKGLAGQVINESAVGVLMKWNLEYSGWSLIGRVIENAIDQKAWDNTALGSLLLVKKTLATLQTEESCRQFVGYLSVALYNQDIVQLLFEHLESLLSCDFEQINLILVLVQLLVQLGKVWPSRVWALLNNSYLIERDGEGGYMTSIIGAVEVLRNDFSFTTHILELIKDVVPSGEDGPTKTKLVQHALDVFESFFYWSYTEHTQRDVIMQHCLSIFDSQPARMELFLAPSKSRIVQPLINALHQCPPEVILASLEFSKRLVSARTGAPSLLEKELYMASPRLVQLSQSFPELRATIFGVFEALILADSSSSLIAHLGSHTTSLLDVLKSAVDNDLELDSTLVAASRLFISSALSKQEGLRVLLMTGKNIREDSTSESLFDKIQDKIIGSHAVLSYEALAALLNAISAHTGAKKKAELAKVAVELINEAFSLKFDDSISTCYFIYAVSQCASIISQMYFEEPDNKYLAAFVEDLKTDNKYQRILSQFFTIQDYNFDLHTLVQQSQPQAAASNPFKQLFPKYSNEFVYKSDRQLLTDANHNLCFVHAQMQLIKGWAKFVSVLAIRAPKGLRVDSVAAQCLETISAREISTPFFLESIEERVGLAFFVLFKAQDVAADLNVISTALALLQNEFVGMSASISQGDAKFYKLLLRILCMQVRALGPENADAHALSRMLVRNIAVDQLPQVVQEAYKDPAGAAEDLQCVIVLLRNCIEISPPSEEPLDTSFAQSFAKLYSGKLELDIQQPVIAKLALTYILEWLKVKGMAWHLLSNGIMQTLLEAPLSELLHSGKITWQSSPHLYQIWILLLEICVRLVSELGVRASVFAELFEERFKAQMQTCFNQWTSNEGRICAPLLQETRLAVMFLKLVSKRHNSIIEQQDELVHAIDHLSSHRKYLAMRMGDSDIDEMVKNMAGLKDILVQL